MTKVRSKKGVSSSTHVVTLQEESDNSTIDSKTTTTTLSSMIGKVVEAFQISKYDDKNPIQEQQALNQMVATIQKILTDRDNNNYNNNEEEGMMTSKDTDLQNCFLNMFDCAISASLDSSSSSVNSHIGQSPDKNNQTNNDDDSIDNQQENPTTTFVSCQRVVDRILKAIAKLTGSLANVNVCRCVLQHVTKFSTVTEYENIRTLACRFIGYLVKSIIIVVEERSRSDGKVLLLSSSSNSTNVIPEEEEEKQQQQQKLLYNELLDIASQTLIPRFTDKSQMVRLAAIQAGENFFGGGGGNNSNDASNTNETDESSSSLTDPDILQAILWTLQHDPSVMNREIACQVIPLNLETIDHIVIRIRDVKAKVRCAALRRLQTSYSNGLLDSSQASAIISAGWTQRCSATKKATEQMIYLGWIKSFHYKPMDLLSQLDVYENESVCEKVVEALHLAYTATDDSDIMNILRENLSENGIHSFHTEMEKATNFELNVESSEEIDGLTSTTLSAEKIFFVNTILKCSKDVKYKETLLTKAIPDIPTLCAVLERNASAVVQAIQQKDRAKESKLCFICMQLLRLACYHRTATMEEGSRRIFGSGMKSMLSNILTPDDLVEGCSESLRHFEKGTSNYFLQYISDIVRDLQKKMETEIELHLNCTIRILSVLSVALEHVNPFEASTNQETLKEFASFVLPLLDLNSDCSSLVRESAVGCLGKLGLLCNTTTVNEKYYPQLMLILQNENTSIAVRAQVLMCLCDLTILLQRTDERLICETTNLLDHTNSVVSCIACEVATKLLLSGLVDDEMNSKWLARLVLLFFQQDANVMDTENVDVMERGNPVRLQQLLSLFFPALCIRSQEGQDAMMGAIGPLLDIIFNNNETNSPRNASTLRKSSRKTSRKNKNLPVTKMIEFICSNVKIGEDALQKENTTKEVNMNNNDDDETEESSPALIAAIQVAGFLCQNHENVDTTQLRNLCKLLGEIHLDIEKEACEHLSILKESMEEFMLLLDDSICVKYLKKLNEILDDIVIMEVDDDIGSEEGEEETSVIRMIDRPNLIIPPPLMEFNENDDTTLGLLLITPTNAVTSTTTTTKVIQDESLLSTPISQLHPNKTILTVKNEY